MLAGTLVTMKGTRAFDSSDFVVLAYTTNATARTLESCITKSHGLVHLCSIQSCANLRYGISAEAWLGRPPSSIAKPSTS